MGIAIQRPGEAGGAVLAAGKQHQRSPVIHGVIGMAAPIWPPGMAALGAYVTGTGRAISYVSAMALDLDFSEDEIRRYSRHILLQDVGGIGQAKLKAARVLIVGAGGLGSPLVLYLAAAGVGTIGIIDHDRVELPICSARSPMPPTASAVQRPNQRQSRPLRSIRKCISSRMARDWTRTMRSN
jgi:hypothetical protein